MGPDLDHWLPEYGLRVLHSRKTDVEPERLWEAARGVRLADTRLLGRLVRWRIPGTRMELAFDELFRNYPFAVLEQGERYLVSGLVGRIWTLRRDYPRLGGARAFRQWADRGTARVVFAHWVESEPDVASLHVEARVQALGMQGRMGLRVVRPLVNRFEHLVGSDGIEAALRAVHDQAPPSADERR